VNTTARTPPAPRPNTRPSLRLLQLRLCKLSRPRARGSGSRRASRGAVVAKLRRRRSDGSSRLTVLSFIAVVMCILHSALNYSLISCALAYGAATLGCTRAAAAAGKSTVQGGGA